MKELIKRVEVLGLDETSLTLVGTLHLVAASLNTDIIQIFEEAKNKEGVSEKELADYDRFIAHQHEEIVDKYVPAFSLIQIKQEESVVLELKYDEDPLRMQKITRDIKMAVERFPMWDRKMPPGEKPPRETAKLHEGWSKIREMVEADKEFMSLVGTGKKDELNKASFRKFMQTSAYIEHPCTIQEFVELRKERNDLGYYGMDFTDYHRWLHRSKTRLDADGNLLPEAREEALRLLTVWKDQAEDDHRYWLCRNLSVHPKHKEVYHRLIAEFHEKIRPTLA